MQRQEIKFTGEDNDVFNVICADFVCKGSPQMFAESRAGSFGSWQDLGWTLTSSVLESSEDTDVDKLNSRLVAAIRRLENHKKPEEDKEAGDEEVDGEAMADGQDPAELRPGRLLRDLLAGGGRSQRATMQVHRDHYHAGARALQTMFRRAGIPEAVVSAVPEVIKKCRACREWEQLPPRPVARLSLATGLNGCVYIDLWFFNWIDSEDNLYRWTFLLIVDEATRFRMLNSVKG